MKNRVAKFKIFIILFATCYLLLFFLPVFAAEFDFKQYPWEKEGITTLGGKEGLVSRFYTYALAAAGVAAFGAIIYGGILWTMSGAVSSQAEAKEWITAAVSGLALLLFAVLLLRLINPAILELKDPSVPPVQDITRTQYSANSEIVNYSQSECTADKGCTWVGNQNKCICSKNK